MSIKYFDCFVVHAMVWFILPLCRLIITTPITIIITDTSNAAQEEVIGAM